jgi:hypothetical protein
VKASLVVSGHASPAHTNPKRKRGTASELPRLRFLMLRFLDAIRLVRMVKKMEN